LNYTTRHEMIRFMNYDHDMTLKLRAVDLPFP
jgi:hypothetical protein